MIFDFLNFKYFLISFSIGIFIVYINTPTPEIIIKYPNPENAGKIIYKDDAGVCYKYKANEVKCPSDNKNIEAQPLQYIENKKPETLIKTVMRLYNTH